MGDSRITPLSMPKWGMAMSTGTIVEWLVEAGTDVREGDELLDIETEKAVVAMEAPGDGKLSRIIAQPGEKLPVGALLGVITEGEVDDAVIDAFVSEFQTHFTAEETADEIDLAPSKIEINGISIAYRKFPARNENDNLPFVLIHGFGGDQNGWVFNIPELGEQHTIYTLDLPGHGESSRQVGEGTLSSLASIVSGLITETGETRAHIVGHSLGAAIAVELAVQDPGQVASLTLLSSAGAGTVVDRKYVEGFIAANRRKQIKPYILQLFGDPKFVNRDMIESLLKAKRIEGTDACLRKLAEASIFSEEGAYPEDKLLHVHQPVQVIWGGQDQIASADQVTKLPANVNVQVIKNAGHMVHIEAAGAVNTTLKDFAGNCQKRNTV